MGSLVAGHNLTLLDHVEQRSTHSGEVHNLDTI